MFERGGIAVGTLGCGDAGDSLQAAAAIAAMRCRSWCDEMVADTGRAEREYGLRGPGGALLAQLVNG